MAATREGGQEWAIRRFNKAEALFLTPLGKGRVHAKLKVCFQQVFSCDVSSATTSTEALQTQKCLDKVSAFSRGPGLRIFVVIAFPCEVTDEGVGWKLADGVLRLQDVVRIWQQNREGPDSQLLVYTDAGRSRLLSLESARADHNIYVQSSAGDNFTDDFVSSQRNGQGVLEGLHAWGFWPMYATPAGQDGILQGDTGNLQLLGTSAMLEINRQRDDCLHRQRSVLCEDNRPDVHVLSLSNPGTRCKESGRLVLDLEGVWNDFSQFTTVLQESGCQVHGESALGSDLTLEECRSKIADFFKNDGLLILAFFGHGVQQAQGAWKLGDEEMSLEDIVALWAEREHHEGPPRARLLIFMDSCYSGSWSKLAADRQYPIYIQSSCRDEETSWDGGHKLDTFTTVFIKYHRCELMKDEVPLCLERLSCQKEWLRRRAAMHPCYYAPKNSPHIFRLPDGTLFFLMGDLVQQQTS